MLALARDGRIRIYTSKALLDELREVLCRPKLVERLQRTGRVASALVRDYRRLALRVRNRQLTTRVSRDADDDAVLACALAAKAHLVVSGDDDLLLLKAFRGIPIIRPGDVMLRLAR